MEINYTFIDQLLKSEEVSGFEEFLALLNFSVAKNTTATNSPSSDGQIIFMMTLSILALILNIFAAFATCHIPNGLTTHSKLIISLAFSDILIVVSIFANQISKIIHEDLDPFTATPDERTSLSCSFAFISSLNITAHLISLLNLLVMAIDHYLAIIKPYQYAFLLNKRNGVIIIVSLWIVAFVGGFINFVTGLGSYNKEGGSFNYCEFIMYNDFQGDYLVIGCTFLCLFSIIFIYLRIYYEVRQMNKRLTMLTFNKEHNSKTLVTTLLIIGTFTLCWMPLFTFQTIMIIQVYVNPEAVKKTFKALLIANKYLYTLLVVNSICDPIIYAVRLKEVQLGYKKFWKSMIDHCSFLPMRKMRRSSMLSRLINRRKNTISEMETVDKTVSLLMSENKERTENNNESA